MVKTQIGLGVLSIPSAFHVLGMIPGVICLILIAIITTWSNYIVGVFKLRHRAVYGIDDAGGLMFGRLGKEFFAAAFCLCKKASSFLQCSGNGSLMYKISQTGFLLPAQACWESPSGSTPCPVTRHALLYSSLSLP